MLVYTYFVQVVFELLNLTLFRGVWLMIRWWKIGDEVILFEPFFDLYVNQVKLAGGKPVFVPLTFQAYSEEDDDIVTGGEWVLEPDMLKKYVTPNTKAIVLNSPHNPTGKIFRREEMEYVAEALEFAGPDCVVISDEGKHTISFF